jgi:hypothetical protein
MGLDGAVTSFGDDDMVRGFFVSICDKTVG